MKFYRSILTGLGLLILPGVIWAQGARGVVPVDVPLPDVTVYDAEGHGFSLTQLKGSYSVLVLGCLT